MQYDFSLFTYHFRLILHRKGDTFMKKNSNLAWDYENDIILLKPKYNILTSLRLVTHMKVPKRGSDYGFSLNVCQTKSGFMLTEQMSAFVTNIRSNNMMVHTDRSNLTRSFSQHLTRPDNTFLQYLNLPTVFQSPRLPQETDPISAVSWPLNTRSLEQHILQTGGSYSYTDNCYIMKATITQSTRNWSE